MNWIFDNIEIVAMVVLVIGSAIKQIFESAKSKREALPRREAEEADDTEWFPIPIPPEYLPPPPLPRTLPPPLQQAPPPPLPSHAEEALHRQMEIQEKLRELRDNNAKAKAKESLPRTGQVKSTASAPVGIRATLRHPSSTRKAIVLREILGPPVGMRN